MGDPKKSRRKYLTPSHPWEGERIAKEKELVRKYGLKNKTELWKAQTSLTTYRSQAKELAARTRVADLQAQTESDMLKNKLVRFGLLASENNVNDVLGLEVEDILSRRLQTIVYHKGLAGTQKQARQFVIHGHISIGDRVVTIPGRLITKKEEEDIVYNQYSPISNELHPMRPQEHAAPVPVAEESHEEKHDIKVTQKAQKVLDKVKAEAKKEGDTPEEPPAEEKPVEKKEDKAESPKTKEGEA